MSNNDTNSLTVRTAYNEILEDLYADNGCDFEPTKEHKAELEVALFNCLRDGMVLDEATIADIVMGEQSEVDERFKAIVSYPRLSAAINTIFENDSVKLKSFTYGKNR